MSDNHKEHGNAGAPLRRTSLGYQVNHLARLLALSLRRRIEQHGVVPGQFAQLLALYEEEPLTQRQLCERVRIEQSTMAYTLQRMERDGLIERKADPRDGRSALVRLTPQSRSVQEKLTRAAQEVNAAAARGIDIPELTTIMSVVPRLIENLENGNDSRQRRASRLKKPSTTDLDAQGEGEP